MSEKESMAKGLTLNDIPKGYRDFCRVVGIEAGVEISRKYGGLSLYIPHFNRVVLKLVREQIRKEFNGVNFKELAQKYGYTTRWIRMVVDKK